jgi:hypothetical protein
MLCYGLPWPRVPASSAKVSSWLEPLLHLVVQITSYVFPYTAKQDSQPTAFLISKQAISYQTRGSTCGPVVSTPKTRSLADLSTTNDITWQKPTISTIPTHAQTTTSILTMVTSHHYGWKNQTLNNNRSQTQHHKDGKTCTTLMIAWLSIANQVWTHIPKVWGLGNSIKACRPVCILERKHIGSIWSRVSCLALLLAAAQSLGHQALGDSQSLWRLTIAIENKQCKQIN